MKKWISLLLCVVLSLSAAATAFAAENYTLPIGEYGKDFLTIACVDNYYTAASYADPLPVLEQIEVNTGIQIKWEVTPAGQYDEVIRVRLAAGSDLPDIVQIPGKNTAYKSEVYTLGLLGTIIPLEDLIREHAPNIAKLIWEDMPELGKAYTAPDGHIYHIAQNYDGTNRVSAKGILIRTDWLETLNLSVPTTADEWYTVLKAFKERDPNDNGIADEIPFGAFSKNGLGEYGYLATAFGLAAPATKYIDDNGTAVCQYDQPGFKDFLTFMNKLYAEGLIDPQYTTGDEAKMNAMAAKDIIGCSTQYADTDVLWEGTARTAGNPNSANAEYTLIECPVAEDGTPVRMIGRTLTGHCYSISKSCKDPVMAIQWLDYVYANPEGRDIMLYGFEGLTYTVDENGNKVWTDYIANNPNGLNISSALRSVGAFPNMFSNRTVEFGAAMVSKDAAQASAALEKYTIQPFPLVMSTEEELDAIASLTTDIDTYENEMIQKFITGQVSMDQFDKFRDTVRAMGGDELTDIYQQQLNRYYGK